MESKRLILSMTIMLAIFLAWKMTYDYAVKHYPSLATAPEQPTTAPTTAASTTQPSNIASLATTGPTTSVAAGGSSGGYHVAPAPSAEPIEIGSAQHANPTYAMALKITPTGAGLTSATLNSFYETAQQQSLYTYQQPIAGAESITRPLATRSVVINGNTIDLANANWRQTSADSTSATYVAVIDNGEQPALEIDKTFHVLPRNAEDGSDGYEVHVTQEFKNLSPQPISVKTTFNGTTTPARENDRTEDRYFIAGFDDEHDVGVEHEFVGSLTTSSPTKDVATLRKQPLLWVGAGNSYFNAIIRPEYAGQKANPPIKIAAAPVTGLNLDLPADQREGSLAVETNEFQLAPGAAAPLNLRVFLGPKQRSMLGNKYYSAFPLSYDRTLVYTSGFCGFLTFGWLINALYGILWFFHFLLRDWGLAIIGLVCLVRIALHPITKKSQVNMMQMGKMGPEMTRLKEKYKDDKDELNKAMMQVYKQQGMTPILGCLPMFLQMPIWIALWSALQSTFDLRQAPFLRFGPVHLTWIKDLSHPDWLMHFKQPVPLFLFGWMLHGINVLPILMGGVYFLQQKFQPQPAAQTPEQEQQRKMMQWMTLLFPLMLYSAPSGLNLYILTSSSLGIIESKIIRDHIKQREEAEKAGRVFIDTKPTRANKRKDKDEPPKKQQKKTGIKGFLADLQAKAEEVRREAERRGKDRA